MIAIPISYVLLLGLLVQDPALSPVQQLAGTVIVDVRNQEHRPVAGAVVRAAGRVLRTAAQGRVQLQLPAGSHTVTVSAEGFREFVAPIIVEAAATTHLEVSLHPGVAIEEKIIVTAARTDRRLEDQPVRIEVVDRDEIEEKALMTPGSIAMLLGETTGLRVQTTAPSLGAANVRIQGLRGRYTQLLSDGLPLYGLQGDSLSLLQVPPLDLAQVEILKGAASALYGPSALGGIINLVSQRPTVRQREVLVNLSSQRAADLNFWMVEPPRGSWAFTLLGGLHGQDRQDLDSDGWADLPRFQRGVFRPRVFWEDGRGRTVFATMGVIAEDRRGGSWPGAAAPDGRPFAQELDTRRIDTGTVVRVPLDANMLLTLRGSFARRAERRLFGPMTERGSHTTWLGEAVIMGNAGRHTWLLGGAVQQDADDGRGLPDFEYRFTTPGIFVQDEVELTARSTLGISARLDRHSRYGTFGSPRISLLYRPAAGWSTRLSAGTGFFAPTPFTEETEETGLSRVRIPVGLVAERARSVSMDTGWNKGPIEVVATLFGSLVRHPLQSRIAGPERVDLVNGDGPVRTWGTELLLRYRREGFTFLTTHGHMRSTERDPNGPERRDVPLTPRNVASMNAIWEGEEWGRFGIEMYYVGRQPLDDNPYRTFSRGHVLFGALLERRFGRIRAFINLENLGNVRQTRWDPLVRPSRGTDGRWTVDAWAPLDGRVINGGLRLIL